MDKKAADLKNKGNEFFKSGNVHRAAEIFAQAEKADATDPVYPSNLSAALYETADYDGCAQAILRAWKLLQGNPSINPSLVVRLSSRLAKALCHGFRAKELLPSFLDVNGAEIAGLRNAGVEHSTKSSDKEELVRLWREWDMMIPELAKYVEASEVDLRRLAKLPLFFNPLDPTREFFSIGTDDVIDLMEGWGPGEAYSLKLDRLPPERLSDIALLFGGVGDGRHALGTLVGLHEAFQKLPKTKRTQFKAHLTLLDVHDATIARDVCILMLLHALTEASDATARAEIKATLTYTFCGAAMPSYCYKRLTSVIEDLRKRFTLDSPGLPDWLRVASDTITAILPTLDFWLTARKSTSRMLEGHEHMSPSDLPEAQMMSMLPGGNATLKKTLEEKEAEERAKIRQTLQEMSPESLAEWPLFTKDDSPEKMRAFVNDNMDKLIDMIYKEGKGGKLPLYEEAFYKGAKVFLPPKELMKRHPGFETAWKQIKSHTGMSQPVLRKVRTHIQTEWKPNITLFDTKCSDPRCYSDRDGYPDIKLDMFRTVTYFEQFNRRNTPNAQDLVRTDQHILASQVCGAFFEKAANALKGLAGHLTVELLCGGLSEELAKMQWGADVTRPKEFPRKYTRMWLSNVPDYTHGPLNVIIYAIPCLQDDPQAAIGFNSLLNTAVWAGDDEFFHTYTLLLPKEVPRYLGCRVISSRVVMDVCILGSQSVPRPLSELATRDELTTWLTRVLFNTFIPGHSKLRPHNVRCPHNLAAFFGLLFYLHRAGYPAHWLSDFLARVLSGRMLSDIAPYDDFWPMPVKERLRRVPARRVRTDPWLVDFEVMIASAYHAVPFPLTGALPADFSREPEDIQVWEATVQPAQYFSTAPLFNFSSPYDPRTQLLFYRASAATATRLIDDMGRIFEGKAEPAPGTFFILTMQEYVQYQECIRFKLSKKRVERMRKEDWYMMAYRPDTGQQGELYIRRPFISKT
ncbi:hypothetical protein C8Q70DRAFT_1055762 [Cubamyces menziesii]|nr:hypothetical protein C8Q70DRAFT_1055762 [Cubamyces menziesii]